MREALCDPRFSVVLKSRITPELLERFSQDDTLVREKLAEYKVKLISDIETQQKIMQNKLDELNGVVK